MGKYLTRDLAQWGVPHSIDTLISFIRQSCPRVLDLRSIFEFQTVKEMRLQNVRGNKFLKLLRIETYLQQNFCTAGMCQIRLLSLI